LYFKNPNEFSRNQRNFQELFFYPCILKMEAEKGKRQLTAEQLENLKKGREKARLVKIQLKEINETRRTEERERKKEAISNEKREKDAKREEAYKAVIELKNAKQERNSKKEVNSDVEVEKPAPKPKSQPKFKLPPPQDEPSEEEEEEIEEVYEPPPRKTVVKPPLPPPSQFKRKPRPQRREPTDAELYQNANIEMLRKRFMEQTRNRLVNDLFNY